MNYLFLIPCGTFLILYAGEYFFPHTATQNKFDRWDWLLNLSGFFMQGIVVPGCGLLITFYLLPHVFTESKGVLHVGFVGAFLLNFIAIDFLYYWQHRWFHHSKLLWRWHQAHHATPHVNIWVTARNSLLTHFLFVYMLINPVLAYWCDSPSGFYFGAMLTAALDIWRHSHIDWSFLPFSHLQKFWGFIVVSPQAHHQHHNAEDANKNFGANLLIWDYIFGTHKNSQSYPTRYQDLTAPKPLAQLFYPLYK